MASELPEEFDLVVIGTGFTESCVAAAASRVGKTVLHIDSNKFYGGAWASFNLEALNLFLSSADAGEEVQNKSYKWNIPAECESDTTPEEGKETCCQKHLLLESRRFNIDLCPKVIYATGSLVKLLISSNICRYAEFRAVDRVCTRFGESIINVPCSRSDVFNTTDLNIVEKRLLMKFLTTCHAYGETQSDEDLFTYRGKTFVEYMQAQHLTPKITTCVMQAIAMCSDTTPFEEGMGRVQSFLSSLGRYGNTPFLFSMYGSGEIPQCFCRLCAVFGGIYCLERRVDEAIINADTKSVSLKMGDMRINTKHVVCCHGNIPPNLRNSNIGIYGFGTKFNVLSRGVFLASSPLGDETLNSGGGGVNLLRLIAEQREAILIQLSHFSGTCPKGLYLFHITSPAVTDNPEEDLKPFMAQVFHQNETSPQFLYSAFFTLTARKTLPDNLIIDADTPIICAAAPYYELDYDLSIKNAQEIFRRLYSSEEFLPRAPDPEEIVVEGEDPRALSEHSLPDDLRAQLRELEHATEQMEIEDNIAAENPSAEQMEAE